MTPSRNPLSRLTAWALKMLGGVLFVVYLVYLPFPQLFQVAAFPQSGLVLYSLATAGSAFVAWGLMLGSMQASGVSRHQVLHASAVGVALLGLMRLATAVFPQPPFDGMILLPLVEFVLFSLLAYRLHAAKLMPQQVPPT